MGDVQGLTIEKECCSNCSSTIGLRFVRRCCLCGSFAAAIALNSEPDKPAAIEYEIIVVSVLLNRSHPRPLEPCTPLFQFVVCPACAKRKVKLVIDE